MFIEEIFEAPEIFDYLQVRGLVNQYQKAKRYLLAGHYIQVAFKLRQPKENGIYSFRINKQFRALAVMKERALRIFMIDNHQ